MCQNFFRTTPWGNPQNFLIYFFFDFRKINGGIKNFEKYTSAAKPAVGARR
jgi:hypothetical protein